MAGAHRDRSAIADDDVRQGTKICPPRNGCAAEPGRGPAIMTSRSLDPFFKPQSVAIIGLSRAAIGAPVSVLTSLESLGYEGRVYVINPSFASSASVKAY